MDKTYLLEVFRRLIETDSTTGHEALIVPLTCRLLDEIGIPWQLSHKGGVIASLGEGGDPLCVTAHLDDIGLMVRKLNPDGTLKVCSIGGLYPFHCIGENVRIYTRDGRVYSGTVCRNPNSIHVTEEELRTVLPDYRKDVCVVLDEDVRDAEAVRALGIESGDIIALEPRFTTVNGYLKSRFIDDKACAALLLTAMRELLSCSCPPRRKVYFYFAAFEEIGHGTSWLPPDVKDILALDIAPTGPDQNSDEHKVSIFAKDAIFPYHWGMTNELRNLAAARGIPYVMDVFTPHYGSDADASIRAGHDVRHAAIGPGTANSHGYERTHMDGIEATYDLLTACLTD